MALEKVAKEFPNIHFTIIDSVVDLPNVQSVVFKEQEGSFLVGVLAALASKSGKVGFVGGMDIPLIRRFQCGFEQGIKYANPKAELIANMTGTTPAAWNDPGRGAELAKGQFDRGVDVVYAAAGSTGIGVLQAAKDRGKLGIGVDSNQNHLHPGTMLTSMLKRVDLAAYNSFKAAQAGTWKGGVQVLGLKEGGVDWALDKYNEKLITPDMKAKVEAAKADIVVGQDRRPRLHEQQFLQVTPAGDGAPAIELQGIDKSFGSVHAVRGVSLRIEKGAITGIVGENGAGKSTLMSILYGLYRADAGEIRVDGRRSAWKARAMPSRTASAWSTSISCWSTPSPCWRTWCWAPRAGRCWRAAWRRRAPSWRRLAREYGLTVDPDALVADLSVGEQQRVEILKVLFRGARILILDEPSAVLTPQETDQLFRILATLKERGVTVVLITHKLREIMAATDHVYVMRQGQIVADRAHRRHQSRGAGRADGRPQGADAARQGAPRPRRVRLRKPSICRWSTSAACGCSTMSGWSCAPARSSASPASRATARPSCCRSCRASARRPAAG